MTSEELYKKEFGNLDSVPKESVIRLLRHFAAVLKKERLCCDCKEPLPKDFVTRCPKCYDEMYFPK